MFMKLMSHNSSVVGAPAFPEQMKRRHAGLVFFLDHELDVADPPARVGSMRRSQCATFWRSPRRSTRNCSDSGSPTNMNAAITNGVTPPK